MLYPPMYREMWLFGCSSKWIIQQKHYQRWKFFGVFELQSDVQNWNNLIWGPFSPKELFIESELQTLAVIYSNLQGYGFLTMLPSGDLLNFGYTGNNHLHLTTLGNQFAIGLDWDRLFYRFWKTRSFACINQSVRVHKGIFHLFSLCTLRDTVPLVIHRSKQGISFHQSLC